ncbi:MarR family winged helix-turn-helix transcriptional regulator [Dactylosporangium sp. NPDC005572]|uniref:winged helix-turn-helix domain-containing protein n=1 Tax=Dactylosporangium sp. NPDC005572 TaxID=3156889 RepID=UPI0033B96D8A
MPPLDDKSQQIIGALAELREETAGNLATHLGIAYPTITPKLRKLNAAGLAESTKADNRQTVWRLTDTGQELAATLNAPAAGSDTEAITATAVGAAVPTPPAGTDQNTAAGTDPQINSEAPDQPDMPVQEQHPSAGGTDTLTIGTDADGAGPDDQPPAAADISAAAGTSSSDLTNAAAADGSDTAATAQADANAATRAGAAAGDDSGDAGGADAAPGSLPGPRLKRRAPGDLDRSILAILQPNPGQVYKVGELCKLINNAERGTGLPKASPGAVVLAAQRLVARKQVVLAVEKPASFQLLADPADPANPAAAPAPAAAAALAPVAASV